MGVRSPGVVCIIGDTAPYIFFLQNGLHIFTTTLTRASPENKLWCVFFVVKMNIRPDLVFGETRYIRSNNCYMYCLFICSLKI